MNVECALWEDNNRLRAEVARLTREIADKNYECATLCVADKWATENAALRAVLRRAVVGVRDLRDELAAYGTLTDSEVLAIDAADAIIRDAEALLGKEEG